MARSGRPGIKMWNAILFYQVKQENGELSEPRQLLNEDGTQYFRNSDEAIEALEDLQIPYEVRYEVFIKLENETKLLIPAKKARIRYIHTTLTELDTPDEYEDLDKADDVDWLNDDILPEI